MMCLGVVVVLLMLTLERQDIIQGHRKSVMLILTVYVAVVDVEIPVVVLYARLDESAMGRFVSKFKVFVVVEPRMDVGERDGGKKGLEDFKGGKETNLGNGFNLNLR